MTYVTRVLQMLETSCNSSRFADRIENVSFAQDSGNVINHVLKSKIEVSQIQLNARFPVNNRIRVLQSIMESHLKFAFLSQ